MRSATVAADTTQLQEVNIQKRNEEKMQNLAAKLIIGTAITAIGMFGADNTTETWKLNPAKSTATSPLSKSRIDVYETTPDGGVKVTRIEERADGTKVYFSYTYRIDGKEYPATGGPFDTISVKRVDANTTSFEVVKKTDGTYHQTGRNVFSKDGKTRTLTVKGTDIQGKPVTATLVFDKQ